MAAKKMTVRDAYAKAKKQGQGKPAPKGALQQRGVKGEARPQNPSARNKVGVKSKNKPGPWDDIARGIAKGGKIAGAVAKEVTKPARDPIGAAVDTIKGIRKDVKEKNIKGLAFQAMTALPVGRMAKGAKALAKGAEAAQGAATVAGNAAKGARVAKKATSAAKKAGSTTKKAAGKTKRSDIPWNVVDDGTRAAKKAAKATRPAANAGVSKELEAANNRLGNIRRAMQDYNGPKFDPKTKKASGNWALFQKREREALSEVNKIMSREQQAGRAAENMKKVGVEKPKSRDRSLGSSTATKKGDERIPLPENTKAYSRIPKNTKDTANPPLEKNQRYAYEADPMKRAEGKERFWRKEERRMDRKAKQSQANKARQAKVDVKEKQARVNANWKEVKAKAATGGPKAQARAERFKKFWNEQGYNLK